MSLKQAILLLSGLVFFICKHQAQTVTDIDGNEYPTVKIGTQIWMAENLKTTRFSDGLNVPVTPDSSSWCNLRIPGYCWYSNAAVYKDIFGALYNWFAVSSGKLAPEGWHVPTEEEWTILTDFLGGERAAGGKMKTVGTIEVGTSYWYTPNTGATNESGFSGLPGGTREFDANFNSLYSYGFWWTASGENTGFAKYRKLRHNFTDVQSGVVNCQVGMSVRCVKDPGTGSENTEPLKLLEIYPNPAADKIKILYAGHNGMQIAVYNLFGEQLLQKRVYCMSDELDISAFSKGVYIIHLTGADWNAQRKLIRK